MTIPDIIISKRILALVAGGIDLPQAVDAVLGAGTFSALASDVYTHLRAN